MPRRNGPARIYVRRMSSKTNQSDLNVKAKDYLMQRGLYDHKKRVGDLEIWCRYEGMECTNAGPTEESVTA